MTETKSLKLKKQNMDSSMKRIKPLRELNLIDDYMFDVATMDLETCKAIIELSLNIRIQEIEWKEGQKSVPALPQHHFSL